jgi:hypothetical protein
MTICGWIGRRGKSGRTATLAIICSESGCNIGDVPVWQRYRYGVRRNEFWNKAFRSQHKTALATEEFNQNDCGFECRMGTAMISTWSEWKRYPRAERGENIEAPISPGIYEVRHAASGALFSFDAVENVASALALLSVSSKSWFARRGPAVTPELEYRTCATSSKADAKAALERMVGRRDTYMSGAA